MRILIVSHIDPAPLQQLRATHEVDHVLNPDETRLKELIAHSQVLVFRSGIKITADVLDAASDLELIVRAGSGLDNIDLADVARRGIRMVRIPGPGAQAVAELVFGLILGVARRITLADRLVRDGHWPKPDLEGNLLTGKVLGIIGVGNIGTRVGELGASLGMKVIGCVEYPETCDIAGKALRGIEITDCDRVLREADYLTIHTPLQDSTYHLINAKTLAQMKHGAYLINTSRGGVVDESALYSTMTANGALSGAALDVHEREGEGILPLLADFPNVVLTPHIGAMAVESQAQIGERLLTMVNAFERDSLTDILHEGELVL